MAERANMNTKRLVLAMVIAVVFGSLASFWATLSELYRLGGAITGAGRGVLAPSVGHIGQFGWLAGLFAFPRDPDISAMSFMAGGMGFTFFLMVMRMRFIWWAPPSSRLSLSP